MKNFILMLVLTLSFPVLSQQQPVNVCRQDPHFKDWDFWIGNWDVYDNTSGKKAGTNLIIKTEDGCTIKEHWTNGIGGKGFSMNYYNPLSQKWRQIWVSGPGYLIDYQGGLNASGAMVLEGHIEYYGTGVKQPFRGTWSQYKNGDVRQFFEVKTKEGVWTVWFDGRYTRRSTP
ncbi:hypothetical protein QGN29_12440 [Temperatibacter marinus]|uniref:DUF1579 domain-containing protein n=1 Tax=Temperatibacter marinus TaxID=1456591 RepID=A0AA52EFV7_9PROT|nr:hypothetical protein [Temperatibacter marinus]WND02358.1 hypothetical protein QGN29_12440 [Temperatibacter marinus]